jgi:peptidoglycan/xylan/chitin deacetylase (PgdA/CDA1 family)
MWLIRAALRRPITVVVAIIAIALTAGFAVTRMRADIFPDLDLPVIFVAQPYGGMSPAQMEGFITYYYEYHFLYINGIESVESKSIQNTSLLKLTFHPGTDMAEALAQTIGYVNRARAFMPPGTVGPFVMRFDAGTVPVGYLVFKSDTRSLGEIQDLALNRVRPQFATLPGLTSPPPFGGSQRTIVIRVDPDRLRSYGMAPDDVIRAVTTGNVIMPSGSVNIGDETRISPMNSVVGPINDLLELPIRSGAGTPVSIRDVASVSDSTDIPTAYALVNGRRAVYIPVTKRPDASTLTVLTYHSVGEVTADYPFDPEVIDATPQSFEAQLATIRRHCEVVGIDDVCEALKGGRLPRNAVMITFDDGYKSCHDVALPLLVKYGLKATFFVATDYVAQRRMFWWDLVNYVLGKTAQPVLRLTYPEPLLLEMSDRVRAVAAAIKTVKSSYGIDPRRFVRELAQAGKVELDVEREHELADRLVMNWDEVRALHGAGMDVQAHTRSHRVLQTLKPAPGQTAVESLMLHVDRDRADMRLFEEIGHAQGFIIKQVYFMLAWGNFMMTVLN